MDDAEVLRRALRAVMQQTDRIDCDTGALLIYCRWEAERGLAGVPPAFDATEPDPPGWQHTLPTRFRAKPVHNLIGARATEIGTIETPHGTPGR